MNPFEIAQNIKETARCWRIFPDPKLFICQCITNSSKWWLISTYEAPFKHVCLKLTLRRNWSSDGLLFDETKIMWQFVVYLATLYWYLLPAFSITSCDCWEYFALCHSYCGLLYYRRTRKNRQNTNARVCSDSKIKQHNGKGCPRIFANRSIFESDQTLPLELTSAICRVRSLCLLLGHLLQDEARDDTASESGNVQSISCSLQNNADNGKPSCIESVWFHLCNELSWKLNWIHAEVSIDQKSAKTLFKLLRCSRSDRIWSLLRI
jgi:hypothetical protein